MELSKDQVLLSVYNKKALNNEYSEVLMELKDNGFIDGLNPKYSSGTAAHPLMSAGYTPANTNITDKGEQYLKEHELID
ncbi:YjcQ family protein [Propionispira raffinosivorans]|uniref:YjcQ family protein n=1 Tax=Propionispira raffinosivorans TaxID=86959 RepID=UPI00037CC771|nr:YjcQ family protein [Propionispira raffinosivorans]